MNINKCLIYMHIRPKLIHKIHGIRMIDVWRVILMSTGGQTRPMGLIEYNVCLQSTSSICHCCVHGEKEIKENAVNILEEKWIDL